MEAPVRAPRPSQAPPSAGARETRRLRRWAGFCRRPCSEFALRLGQVRACARLLRCQPSDVSLQLRQASWDRQLDAYVRPGGTSPPAHRSLRARLADAVKAAPESPEGWWTLLQQEEAWAAVAAAGATAGLERGGAARGGVALLDLYRAATKTVPRQNNYGNEAFVKLWLGFARQQW